MSTTRVLMADKPLDPNPPEPLTAEPASGPGENSFRTVFGRALGKESPPSPSHDRPTRRSEEDGRAADPAHPVHPDHPDHPTHPIHPIHPDHPAASSQPGEEASQEGTGQPVAPAQNTDAALAPPASDPTVETDDGQAPADPVSSASDQTAQQAPVEVLLQLLTAPSAPLPPAPAPGNEPDIDQQGAVSAPLSESDSSTDGAMAPADDASTKRPRDPVAPMIPVRLFLTTPASTVAEGVPFQNGRTASPPLPDAEATPTGGPVSVGQALPAANGMPVDADFPQAERASGTNPAPASPTTAEVPPPVPSSPVGASSSSDPSTDAPLSVRAEDKNSVPINGKELPSQPEGDRSDQPPPGKSTDAEQAINSEVLLRRTTAQAETVTTHGMTSAKQPAMKQTERLLTFPGRSEAVVSGAESDESVAAIRGTESRPLRAVGDVPSPGSWLASAVSAPQEAASTDGKLEIPPVRLPAVEGILNQISDQVLTFKRLGTETMAVTVKPEDGTELFLRLSLRNGQVEMQARVGQGDVEALRAHWGELQQSLAQQGVRVGPLHSPLFGNSWQGQAAPDGFGSPARDQDPPPQRFQLSDPIEAARPRSGSAATLSKPQSARATTGESRRWETWA